MAPNTDCVTKVDTTLLLLGVKLNILILLFQFKKGTTLWRKKVELPLEGPEMKNPKVNFKIRFFFNRLALLLAFYSSDP